MSWWERFYHCKNGDLYGLTGLKCCSKGALNIDKSVYMQSKIPTSTVVMWAEATDFFKSSPFSQAACFPDSVQLTAWRDPHSTAPTERPTDNFGAARLILASYRPSISDLACACRGGSEHTAPEEEAGLVLVSSNRCFLKAHSIVVHMTLELFLEAQNQTWFPFWSSVRGPSQV